MTKYLQKYQLAKKTEPRPYQAQVEDFMFDAIEAGHKGLGLFMWMGTGKTREAITISANLFLQDKIDAVMVVAPKAIYNQWYKEEIPKHCPVSHFSFLWKNSTSRYYKDDLMSFLNPHKNSRPVKIYNKPVKEVIDEQKEKTASDRVDSLFADESGEDDGSRALDVQGIRDLFAEYEDEDKGEGQSSHVYIEPFTGEDPLDLEAELGKIEKENEDNQKELITKDGKDLKFFIVNIERFSTNPESWMDQFIDFCKDHRVFFILDEATRIKNPSAKRTNNLLKVSKHAEYRTPLTGTLVTNSPFDAWSIGEFMQPGLWGCNYFMFQQRHGIMIRDVNQYTGKKFNRLFSAKDFELVRWHMKQGRGQEEIAAIMGVSPKNINWIIENPQQELPFKRLDEIKDKLLPFSVFVSKEEALPDLPPKVFKRIDIEMNKDQERIYKELKEIMLSKYDGAQLTVDNKLTLMMRLQQVCGGFFPSDPHLELGEQIKKELKPIGDKNPKLVAIQEFLDNECDGDEKVIIWSRFVAEIQMLIKSLRKLYPNKRTEAYYGGVKGAERIQIEEDFKAGKIDFLVMNEQTGAMGLNFQISTLHFFFSNHFSIEMRLQAEDRSHRFGQMQTVRYIDLVVPKSVDFLVYGALRNKMDLVNYFKGKSLKELI